MKTDRVLNYLMVIAITVVLSQQVIINQFKEEINSNNNKKNLYELCKK